MSNAALSHSDGPHPRTAANMGSIVAVVLAIWLAAVVYLSASGALVTPPGEPPLRILIAVIGPLAVFFAAFWTSRSFHEFVATADLRLVNAIQAWRAGGLVFLAFYAYGLLPGLFAWPAGAGDIAIGVTAPWIVLSLIRRPGFASSAAFRLWNWLGLLDLVVAIGLGALGSAVATGLPGEITTAPMALLPLVLIPAYLVPIFAMLHFAALYQARRRS